MRKLKTLCQSLLRLLLKDVEISGKRAIVFLGFLGAVGIGLLILLILNAWASKPEFATVEGTVTLDGKPLAGVYVGYYPVVYPDAGPRAQGITDRNGHYILRADVQAEGVVVGRQQVVVVPEGDEEARAKALIKVPEKYNDLLNTPLEFSVRKGAQTIDLQLASEH